MEKPKVLLFFFDEKDLVGKLIVTNNVGHYHNTDNVIVESFRAVNHTLREKEVSLFQRRVNQWAHEQKCARRNGEKVMPTAAPTPGRFMLNYTAGFPKYDTDADVTTCVFRPSNIDGYSLEELGRYAAEDIAAIKPCFEKLLKSFFESYWEEYSELLEKVYNAKDMDEFTPAVRNSKNYIKEFLKNNGFTPCSKYSKHSK